MGVGDYGYRDQFGHGVATTSICYRTAPQADIYSLRVLNKYGQGKSSDIIKGLETIVENVPRPTVINMSLGTGKSLWSPLESACEMAERYQGVTIVCASGNTSGSVLSPASSPATIAVGALNAQGKLAEYSSYGDEQTCVSFGDVTVTSLEGAKKQMRGTSFAAPRVTAQIACVLSSENIGDVNETELIKNSSVDLGEPGKDPKFGYGLVSGGPMSTAPVEGEKPLGGLYPITVAMSLSLICAGVVVTTRWE